jgi:hypothetical protein
MHYSFSTSVSAKRHPIAPVKVINMCLVGGGDD